MPSASVVGSKVGVMVCWPVQFRPVALASVTQLVPSLEYSKSQLTMLPEVDVVATVPLSAVGWVTVPDTGASVTTGNDEAGGGGLTTLRVVVVVVALPLASVTVAVKVKLPVVVG